MNKREIADKSSYIIEREIVDKSDVIEREIITSNHRIKTNHRISEEIIDKINRKNQLEKKKKPDVKNSVIIENSNLGYILINKQDDTFLRQLYNFLTQSDNKFISKTSFGNFSSSFNNDLPKNFKKIVWKPHKNVLYKLIVFLKEVEIIEGSIWVATKNVFTDAHGSVFNLGNSNGISENNSDYKKLYNGFIKPFKEKINF